MAAVPTPASAHESATSANFGTMLARESPAGMLMSMRARRFGLPSPFAPSGSVRCDVGKPWRMDWGGHDPATPIAEMNINYHNSVCSVMLFVCFGTVYLITKR